MAGARERNVTRALSILRSRHFKRLFRPDGELSRDAEIVLADLQDFCRGRTTVFSQDPAVMARNAGRREVWLRLCHYLGLDEAETLKMMEVEHD